MNYSQIEFLCSTKYILSISLIFCAAIFFYFKRKVYKLPPGPYGVPFLGYLPFLGKDPHFELQRLSEKYGDVYGLYLGSDYTVIITNEKVAKNLFKTHLTSDRPHGIFQFTPGGAGIVETNGPDWLEQRRYTIQKMKNLGFGVSKWEKKLQEELSGFVELIAEQGGQPFDINPLLSASISNNVVSLVSGHHLPMGDVARKIVDSGVDAFERIYDQTGLINAFPRIFKLGVLLGLVNGKDQLAAMVEMNRFVKKIVNDLKEETSETYIQEYWKEIENRKDQTSGNSFNLQNLIGNSQALIFAGSDTTKVSLQWLYIAMAAFQDIQKKVHEELDTVLGREEQISWQDRLRLPYTHAVILEAQRWRSVAPLNIYHKAGTDLEVGEFVIPKGTNIMAFIWGIHMNPRNWKDPDTFIPERFLDQDGSVTKNIDNFVPFSFGKRKCIGETIAYIELFLYFVCVMQKFRILPPEGVKSPNLNGHCGLTLHPSTQKLRFIVR